LIVARTPSYLIYGLDDRPPALVRLALGLQHVAVMSVGWIFVVVVVSAIGGSRTDVADVIRASMIASGVATILQARVIGAVGSGYLCPFSAGPAYIAASIQAGRAGGLPLIFGMTALMGLFEGLMSRVIGRLRVLFPPEVTGLVVAMVGIELVGLATPRITGFRAGEAGSNLPALATGLATLAAMVGPTIWGTSRLRLYPVLIGLAVGYATAAAFGLLTWDALRPALGAPLVGMPRLAAPAWSFDASAAVTFIVASVSSTLKIVGDLTMCQKTNDADWTRTDMKSVSGGILVGGISTGLAGLLGGMGQSTFSSNVGLSIATGATSRVIAWPCGAIVISLAFFPRLANLFAAMPEPVMGAILVYVASFMIVGGIQVLSSRMLDARKTFVVGIAFIFGLSVEMVPGLYAGMPAVLAPLFSSSLSLATVLVVALNLVMRIGIAKRRTLELTVGAADQFDAISRFMNAQGAAWGARPDVISRAIGAMNEFVENAGELELSNPVIRIDVIFDEFNLDVVIRYDGVPLAFPSVRPPAEVLHEPAAVARLAGFMIRRYTDRIDCQRVGRQCTVLLHFDH
jgi:NCS2 family nucleobase:cation symporter-2